MSAGCAQSAHQSTIQLGFLIFQLKVELEIGAALQEVLQGIRSLVK